jgi:DNA topoisomerase-1
MSKNNLVIVESPAKAKTIGKYLGKDYIVMSSFGHIRDLPKKGLNIDKDNNFKPTYEIPDDKKKVVSDLKKEAKKASTIWLASDEDREGEAIAWHLCTALNIDCQNAKRIVFHEITKQAIDNAIKNPRAIDIGLVDAQQARRVLDRLVGYELSPILWKKVKSGLSAGRVQSVAVRLIVEREREIQAFESSINFKVTGIFVDNNNQITADLDKKIKTEKEVKQLLEDLKSAKYTVGDISEKPGLRNPSPPFTTSTLQQEAFRKLGFSVKQTMTLAQRLYENGHITYMRTDSTNLSSLAINSAKTFIVKNYGGEYLKTRNYQTKNSSAQEAHEAIRPTNISTLEAGENPGQINLYRLIWKRMVASQMAAAKANKTEVVINIDNRSENFLAKGEVLQFDGYFKIYGGAKDNTILPPLKTGSSLDPRIIEAHQNFSKPPSRYSEASLVKTMEDLGIGRPSTYAPTINTIQSREYVEKVNIDPKERTALHFTLENSQISKSQQTESYGADKNKLIPTHIADITTDFLVKYFDQIIDYNFTANIEKGLDNIAEKKENWQDSINVFYRQFHPLIVKAGDATRQETSKARLLGQDPKTKRPIYARFGKYGPMLQCGEVEDKEDKPVFAPMPGGVKIEEITLEQALEMFTLPRKVGSLEDGREILANIGRFGPYIVVDKTFVSIKPLDPFSIDENKARELFRAKLEQTAKREIKNFDNDNIKIIKGPYGPYVTNGSKNARIPKGIAPESLDLNQAKEILENSKPKRKRVVKKHK